MSELIDTGVGKVRILAPSPVPDGSGAAEVHEVTLGHSIGARTGYRTLEDAIRAAAALTSLGRGAAAVVSNVLDGGYHLVSLTLDASGCFLLARLVASLGRDNVQILMRDPHVAAVVDGALLVARPDM